MVMLLSAASAGAQIIAMYEFNETSGTTAADSSGNGNDGTYNGGFTLDGSAVNLDGSTGWVSSNLSTLTTAGGGIFSIEMAVSTTDSSTDFLMGSFNGSGSGDLDTAFSVQLNRTFDGSAYVNSAGSLGILVRGEDNTLDRFGVSIPAFYNGITNTIRFDYDVTQTNVADRLTVSFNGSPVALAASGNSNGTPNFVVLEHSFGIGTINLRGSATTFADITVDSFTAAVPEPGTYGLLLGALALAGVLLRRRLGR